MRSLRRRLLISLWIAVLAVGVVSAAVAYLQVSRQAKGLLDNQLAQIAVLVSGPSAGTRPPPSDDSDIEVAVWDADGTLKYSSSTLLGERHAAHEGFSDIRLSRELYRMYATEIGGQHVEVAQPVDVREDQAEVAAIAALLPVLLLIPALAIVIGFVIRKLLQPVRELAQVVARRDDFAQETLPSAGLPTELKPLVEEINKLLTRQREAAERERAFIADAAHALRTPLAALQLQADVLEGSADAQERAARLADLRAGIQRAARLSTQLLSLARAESGAVGNPDSVALDDALLEVNSLYGPTAKTASVALSVEGSSGVRVRTDLRRLILVFGNLLENALRYSPPGARIDVLTRREGKDVEVQVLDEGPGIPESEIVRVFERFHRPVDDDRSGSGLGLATVQSLVRQIGGEVTLHNRADRRGLCARVVLPCTNPTG